MNYHGMEITEEEIQNVKKEYLEEHTYIGTDKPVVLDDKTAAYVIFGRRRFQEYLNSVDESHEMTEWRTEIMAPSGTARYYSYRQCKKCEYEQYYSVAGRFIDPQLTRRCSALPPIPDDFSI
jgi:queuine/archaeosine tRNA-ribosyltransferase